MTPCTLSDRDREMWIACWSRALERRERCGCQYCRRAVGFALRVLMQLRGVTRVTLDLSDESIVILPDKCRRKTR